MAGYIQYFLISAMAFLGLYCGLAVGKMAPEELQPGRQYLVWLMHALFAAILGIFLYLNPSVLFFTAIPVVIILFSLSRRRETLYYHSLPLMMMLSYQYNGFTLIAPLIFLYGFPLASIYLADNPKESLRSAARSILVKYSGFLAISLCFAAMMAFI